MPIKQLISDHIRRAAAADRDNDYVAFHGPRYELLLALLSRYVKSPETALLDVGRSELTDMIAQQFSIRVDSLGFPEDGTTTTGLHYQFNLNDTQCRNRWRLDLPRYDIIVFAEVIEHLYTSPTWVLGYLKSLLAEDGILIVQTPNALALPRRLRMFFGRHPYPLINENVLAPDHYREYTEQELRTYANKLQLRVLDCVLESYFDARFICHLGIKRPRLVGEVLNVLYGLAPRNLRLGITLVVQRGIA